MGYSMSFNGPNTQYGIARSLQPIMIRHNGNGTSDFYIDGQLSGTRDWSTGWIELLQTPVDTVVTALEIFDSSGEMFMFGMGASGSEIIELQVPPGGNGLIPIEFVQNRRLVIKCDSIPSANSYMLINFYQPTALAVSGERGYPAIFEGDSVKLLKDKFDLAGRAQFIAGDQDPRVVGVQATPSSLYFFGDPTEPILYIKRSNDDHDWDIISADEVLTVLGDILDVSIEGVQDGETICYDAASASWLRAPVVEPLLRPKFIPMDESVAAKGEFDISEFRSIYPEETHKRTLLQVASTPKFLPAEIVLDIDSLNPLYEFQYLLPAETIFWVRCKFISDTMETRWSSYRMVTTRPWYVLMPQCWVQETAPKNRKITSNTMDWTTADELVRSTYMFIGDNGGHIDEFTMSIGTKD